MMHAVTDHTGQAARINPDHVTHVICHTDPQSGDSSIPERMTVGLTSGITLTFYYRTPDAASLVAASLANPAADGDQAATEAPRLAS